MAIRCSITACPDLIRSLMILGFFLILDPEVISLSKRHSLSWGWKWNANKANPEYTRLFLRQLHGEEALTGGASIHLRLELLQFDVPVFQVVILYVLPIWNSVCVVLLSLFPWWFNKPDRCWAWSAVSSKYFGQHKGLSQPQGSQCLSCHQNISTHLCMHWIGWCAPVVCTCSVLTLPETAWL